MSLTGTKANVMSATTLLAQQPPCLAFTTPIPLHATKRAIRATHTIRRRPRVKRTKQTTLQMPREVEDANSESKEDPYKELFSEEERSLWDEFNLRTALRPLTEEEKTTLRNRLPLPVANFLIRRGEDAERLLEDTEESFFGKLLKDLPPDTPDEDDEEYSDYVFETAAGPPGFRFSGDGLPDVVPDDSMDETIDVGSKNVMSLFVGRVGSVDEQASKVGYGLLALFIGWLLFKVFFALISFFVSFTFSFFAIFALSAGIFMVFFFFRW